MKLKITIGREQLVFFAIFLIALAFMGLVAAYGGSQPSVMGHSAGELDLAPLYISGGNVGIGTASPGQKLTVAGTIETTSGGVKFPDGTTQTTAAAGFGSWTSISANTVYPAATDGFVMARGYFTATNGYIVIKTDGSNPPATTRQSKGGTGTLDSNYIYSIMSPVRKGDFYKVETGSFTILAIYWLPIGR